MTDPVSFLENYQFVFFFFKTSNDITLFSIMSDKHNELELYKCLILGIFIARNDDNRVYFILKPQTRYQPKTQLFAHLKKMSDHWPQHIFSFLVVAPVFQSVVDMYLVWWQLAGSVKLVFNFRDKSQTRIDWKIHFHNRTWGEVRWVDRWSNV